MLKHFVSMLDREPRELAELVSLARSIKRAATGQTCDEASLAVRSIERRILGMVFFNPSLRTRTSFEAAMLRYGGHAITLNVGGDSWKLEHRDGVVMDGDAAEHLKEAAPVLSRYCDVLGVRTFAGLKDAAEDAADRVVRGFALHATVPVINLESAIEHPCQGLADWMTVAEKLGMNQPATGRSAGRPNFVLTWAPQVKGLPMAVPHSAVLAASAAGCDVTIAHPSGYELNENVIAQARSWCAAAGTTLTITNEQRDACRASDALYAKSWGSRGFYGDAVGQAASFARHRSWMVTRDHLGPQSILMHCLPVRRNVVIADDALDDSRCVVVDQAENRMWVQAAVLAKILSNKQ